MKRGELVFRQLFDPLSSTFTYLLGCTETGEALLIDPVLPAWQRDLQLVNELGLRLVLTVETHIHADHLTSATVLRRETGSRIAAPAMDALPCADLGIEDGVALQLGGHTLVPMHTPGHTDHHFSIFAGDRVFTGDALLIDGCGRTDFQSGDPRALFDSVHRRLFTLPPETLVYPAHDYKGRFVSSIAQEKQHNARLGEGRSLEQFVLLMDQLNLPYPKFIDYAVPGNRNCGVCTEVLPEHLRGYGEVTREAPQG